jgi:hypothetical protein
VVLSLCTPSFARAYPFSFPVIHVCAQTLWIEIFVCGLVYLVYDCGHE